MKFLLNEKSLHGQFTNVEEFLESLAPMIGCIKIIHEFSDMSIYKIEDFYKCKITQKCKIADLKGYSGQEELLRFQISLDEEIYGVPYWDGNPVHDMTKVFLWKGQDVSATALAEAAVTEEPLLSFASDEFKDCLLLIEEGEKLYEVDSVYTPAYLIEHYKNQLKISREDILRIKYAGTRIDCSRLEEKYGPSNLEKNEFQLLLSTFDKFVRHENWENIERDDGLEYKKYRPSSSKYDWFHSARYKGKIIMKFRFSDVLRCYGYRKNDKFMVLRLERDHSVSDNG